MLTIRFETDEWRELLVSAIDDAEAKHGVCEDVTYYDLAADALRNDVLRSLSDSGIDYSPAYRQSVGTDVLLQGGGSDEDREAFDSAIEAMLPGAIQMVDRLAAKAASNS